MLSSILYNSWFVRKLKHVYYNEDGCTVVERTVAVENQVPQGDSEQKEISGFVADGLYM